MEANIAYLEVVEDDFERVQGGEHVSLARESTLRKNVAGLQVVVVEKSVLEVDREAAYGVPAICGRVCGDAPYVFK